MFKTKSQKLLEENEIISKQIEEVHLVSKQLSEEAKKCRANTLKLLERIHFLREGLIKGQMVSSSFRKEVIQNTLDYDDVLTKEMNA